MTFLRDYAIISSARFDAVQVSRAIPGLTDSVRARERAQLSSDGCDCRCSHDIPEDEENVSIMTMILQNLLFPSPATCAIEQMYFRRKKRKAAPSWSDSEISVLPKENISFDTYFNGFSLDKWLKYTVVKDVRLVLRLSGRVRVALMRKEKFGSEVLTEVLAEFRCETPDGEEEEFTFPFTFSSPHGMLCFAVYGEKGKSQIYGGYYAADVPDSEVRDVRIALDICTFRREGFVKKNLELLKDRFLDNDASPLYDKLEVFVADNACTLDSADLPVSKKIHIFPNRNVGGAGGFTRGMMEIRKASRQCPFSHVLVMDDDIRIEPEAIYRTVMLLSLLREEYSDAFVGGAMLRLDKQYFQVESGAVWNGGNLISLKQGLDMRQLDACLFNEIEETPQYNAWWYCAFPLSVVRDDNLPLPIFIRGDDVEYGLRNMKHLILLNGVCVWHEAFENKYSSFLYYYILRNRLIDNAARHIAIPLESFLGMLRGQVLAEVRLYRYRNAHLLMDGVEDFLRGVDWLKAQDGEKLHGEVMSRGYKLENVENLGGVQFLYALYEASRNAVNDSRFIVRLIKHFTLNGTYLKPKRAYNIVPAAGVAEISVYRTQTVLNYDFNARKGFVTQRDPKEAKACAKRLKKLETRLKKEYESACADYRDRAGEITNTAFWENYLGIGSV